MRLPRRKQVIVAVCLAIAAAAGYIVQGSFGLLLWPLGFCGSVLLLAAGLFTLDVVITIVRHQARIRRIQARVRSMTSDQLRELLLTPSHQDSAFARIELMRRGVNARPPKEQLFGMLASGNSLLCGQAMTYMHMFYPKTHARIPSGSSNQDSREVWEARIASLRSAG